MRALRQVLAALVAMLSLSALAGAAPASAACTAASKASFAKIQVWADRDCLGGSMIAKDDLDQPNMAQFKNYDGKVYDVDNTRSSVSVAAGWCARFFDLTSYRSTSAFYCAAGTTTVNYNISAALDNKASSMKVCPNGARPQCDGPPPPTTTTAGSTPPPTAPEQDPIVDSGGGGEGEVPASTDPGMDPVDPFADPGAPGTGDPAAPAGPAGELEPLGPEDGLRFDRATRRCSHRSSQGALAFRVWLREAAVLQRRQADIYRCPKRRAKRDLHSEGRAVDVIPASRAAAEDLIARLLADDFALIRRMGVQEIIYDGQVWSAARPSSILRRYHGSAPHRRSVHVGLNRKGAAKRTSFWAGR